VPGLGAQLGKAADRPPAKSRRLAGDGRRVGTLGLREAPVQGLDQLADVEDVAGVIHGGSPAWTYTRQTRIGFAAQTATTSDTCNSPTRTGASWWWVSPDPTTSTRSAGDSSTSAASIGAASSPPSLPAMRKGRRPVDRRTPRALRRQVAASCRTYAEHGCLDCTRGPRRTGRQRSGIGAVRGPLARDVPLALANLPC
jgi:hypothetical protein